jgi:predicted ribosome quality control (RQC) complex YloA/Tae2 family protein
MKTYTSHDGIIIKVGENAKDNDTLTMSSYPKEWWMHAAECPGSHVIICHEGDTVPKETKRDAAVLAIHHSKTPKTKMSLVDMVRVEQIHKYANSNHGQVHLIGDCMTFTIFMNRENGRLERLLKNRNNS